MATQTINTTTHRSDNNGSSWYALGSSTASYIGQKGGTYQTCFPFVYTPTPGYKLKSISFTCSIAGVNGYSWNGPWIAELYKAERPYSNLIGTATRTNAITSSYVQYTFDIVFSNPITINEATQFCIGIYGNHSLCYQGVVNITEELAATSVYFDDVLKYTFEDMSDSNKITSSQLPTRADEVGKSFKGWSNNQFTLAEVGAAWNTLQISGQTDIFLYADWIYEDVLIDGEILANISNKIKILKGKTRATEYTPEELVIALQELIDT